jgi:putative tryptophan/tyrosine transport system substrate-binding protein
MNDPQPEGHMASYIARRRFLATLLGGAAAGWPLAARAQQAAMPVIGYLHPGPPDDPSAQQSLGAFGLVDSLSRPGANITGVSNLFFALTAKRLELLHDLVPTASVVALLVNPKNAYTEPEAREAKAAARALGLHLDVMNAINEIDVDEAFATLVQRRAGALLVGADPVFTSMRDRFVALAAQHKVPASYAYRDYAAVGGLTSYGTSRSDSSRQVGIYTGRILKGEKPADLPVQQPSKFELIINLKTARALGLHVPTSILLRADEVIE